jgi:putative transposase
MDNFVDSYNHIQRHTGIGLNTPADVHHGLAGEKATSRETTIA